MPLPVVFTRFWLRFPIAVLIFAGCTAVIPRWWCGRDANRWFDGDKTLVLALAREVAATAKQGVSDANFTSNNPVFRGEWQFGTYQMTALGLLQIVQEHPETRAEFMPVIDASIDRMLTADVRAFDTAQWREDALASLDGPNSHAAYLGYMNVVLGVHRRVVPQSRFAELNDRISNALSRRLAASPAGILETYPHEAYPVDTASVVSSLILHTRNTGTDHSAAVTRTLNAYRGAWLERPTGLLNQSLDAGTGRPVDRARASGSALGAQLLAYSERTVSKELYSAVQKTCGASFCGFGFVDEYPHNESGEGDVDSGPLIFGISPSGCAFSLSSARAFGDRERFVQLYRTTHLMGTPVDLNGRRTFVTGGPLGNAILLAMLTTQRQLP